jgi:ADP-heptose:LPS heptosyltransferase
LKFLIIRFSSIGDIILTTPIIRCLKLKYPDAEIHFLTKKAFYPVIKANPYIDHFHIYDNSLATSISALKHVNFDHIIDLHKNLRTFLVKCFLLKKSHTFDKINYEKWLMVNFKKNKLPEKHIVDRYFEGVSSLGVKDDGAGLDYYIAEEDILSLSTFPESHKNEYTVIVCGAKFKTKQYPAVSLKKLCEIDKRPWVILGGKEDKKVADIIASSGKHVLNLCGQLNINQSASVISRAKAVLTNDTGLMHMAAAFQKPLVVLWGNTIPAFGMYPYFGKSNKDKAVNLEVNGLSCRPCSKIGFHECPKKHFRCMNDIQPEQILKLL